MTIPLLPMPIANHQSNNVSIVAMQLYIPKHYVEQKELELHDGVSTGKYTIGLGQERMSFCFADEDAVSMGLTAVKDLLESYDIAPCDIGRIEVGSESNPDRSKSIKTHIVGLHPQEWRNCGGTDCINACFGGTAALLNSLNWIESREWNGKYAFVVMTDVAEYGRESAARATGGAGAVALLLGRDAPLVVERERIVYHCEDVYDFYKPIDSEYPIVDGALSIQCYLNALKVCASQYICKDNEDYSYLIMHTPYCKLIQKGCKALEQQTGKEWTNKAAAGLQVCRQVGNMYTAAMYASLASVLAEARVGDKVLAFSYGSGLISCMFEFRVCASVEYITRTIRLTEKLSDRVHCTIEEYEERSLFTAKSSKRYVLLSDEGGKLRYGWKE